MTADLSPLRLLLVTLAGWVNRHQQQVIEYLVEESHVLREQLKGRRVRLTDDQRRRLAAKGQPLGRRILRQVATIVTPDTILRWHRSRRDSLSRPLGRPVALLLSGGVTVGRVFGQYGLAVLCQTSSHSTLASATHRGRSLARGGFACTPRGWRKVRFSRASRWWPPKKKGRSRPRFGEDRLLPRAG